MQSMEQTSTQDLSFTPMHGSAIMYAISQIPSVAGVVLDCASTLSTRRIYAVCNGLCCKLVCCTLQPGILQKAGSGALSYRSHFICFQGRFPQKRSSIQSSGLMTNTRNGIGVHLIDFTARVCHQALGLL